MNFRVLEGQARLRRIAAKASSLADRLAGVVVPVGDGAPDDLGATRLARWLDRAADGDTTQFGRRLSWLGLTRAEAERLLGPATLAGDEPAWLRLFSDAMDGGPPTRYQPDPVVPFGRLLAPFVHAGLRRLAPACERQFAAPLADRLADDLVAQLLMIAGPTLYLEFSAFRSATGAGAPAPESSRILEAFESALLAGRLWDLFDEYAALARLLAETTLSWVHNVSMLAQHIEDDRPVIEAAFCDGRPLGSPLQVIPSLSDRHNGGASVTAIVFESGVKLVHKPRNLKVEEAWFGLLSALDARGEDFLCLRVVNRPDHGWAEMIDAAPCSGPAEVHAFYRRAGKLLALLYAFEASDCFYENIIACGAYPVLIDMETLMHHVLRRASDLATAEEAAGDVLFDSVFRAGFLPSWESDLNGVSVDISGLGAQRDQTTPYLRRRWLHINTDAMQLTHEPGRIESDRHLPRAAGQTAHVADHADAVIAGFRQMYGSLMAERGGLVAAGALDDLGRSTIRLVFHATRIYGLLLKRLYAPRYLRAGVDRSIELDVISRFYLQSQEKTRWRAMLEAELVALERLDIPYFAVPADSRSLHLPTGKTIENAFDETAIERAKRRLQSMNPADLARQCEFIRASLSMSAMTGQPHAAADRPAETSPLRETGSFSADALMAEAVRIAAEIERRAIISADGSATWIAPQLMPRVGRHELRPLRFDLYGGLAGLALFYAAMQAAGHDGRRMALAVLAPLRRFAAVANGERLRQEGYSMGAGTGVGSLIYTLVRCSELLDEPALLADARSAAAALSEDWIAADDLLDVLSGCAGAIIGLLALDRAAPGTRALDKAILCGNRLLAMREQTHGGAAWRTGQGKMLTGFSHGAAGIALALLRLAAASGDQRFHAAAAEAIAFEEAVFDAAAGNWPDFRQAGHRRFMNAWCHGATGIGLARLAGLRHFDTPAVRRDIDAAIRVVTQYGIGTKDGLCCGNLGRAALLQAAANQYGAADRGAAAAQLAGTVLRRARIAGGYCTSANGAADFFDPSLFQGLSGIGYQLLRLAAPQTVPDVLAWE